jgi:hypothetical protein
MRKCVACVIRKIGKWLVCVADRMAQGSERVEIVIDNDKRQAMLKAVESDCDLASIREKGRMMRQERMERAKLALG